MNLWGAIWPFGKAVDDDAQDGDPSPAPTEPVVDVYYVITDDGELDVDAVPSVIGTAPNGFGGPILIERYAPSRLQVEPNRTPAVTSMPVTVSAQAHALALIKGLIQWDFGGRELESARLQALYVEMCYRLRLKPASWNVVAAELRRMTGAGKRYKWFKLETGEPHRLRVHPIPEQMPSTRVVPLRRAEPATKGAA